MTASVSNAQAQHTPAATNSAQRGFVVAPEPFKLENIGLTVFVPEGAQAKSSTMGGKATAQIAPPDNAWLISIQSIRVAKAKELRGAADHVLEAMLEANGELEGWVNVENNKFGARNDRKEVVTRATLLERVPEPGKTLNISNGGTPLPIERFYASVPALGKKPAFIKGYTLAGISPTEFIAFELAVPEPEFAHARILYESLIASAQFEDPTNANTERAAAVAAMQRSLQNITPGDLRAIVDAFPERWERLFKPSVTGKQLDDTEIGYRQIRFEYGARKSVDRKGRDAGVGGGNDGFIVRVNARFLQEDSIIDSESAFFVSPDKQEESWSVVMGVQTKDEKTVHTEVGARMGNEMSVYIQGSGIPQRSITPLLQGEGYMSRAESYLLPHLLVRSKVPAIYGAYVYNSPAETIRFRRDTVDRPSADRATWKVVTKFADGQPEQSAYYKDDGSFVQATLQDGITSEPMDRAKILQLWKQKSLPLE